MFERPSPYELTPRGAQYFFRLLGDHIVTGQLFWESLTPAEKLHIFECRYLQLPAKDPERKLFLDGHHQELTAAYDEWRVTGNKHGNFDFAHFRSQLDAIEARLKDAK